MNKAQALKKIAKEIGRCRICKKESIGKAVVGEGNPDARAVFIGEAPGKTEAVTGRTFVGRSGKFLRANMKKIGLDDRNVYITSPVKYLPKRGTPSLSQIAHGGIHLHKQLAIIKPRLIVLMGSVAAIGTLGEKIPVAKLHGQTLLRGKQKFFILYHPAAALRFFRHELIKDFRKLKRLL